MSRRDARTVELLGYLRPLGITSMFGCADPFARQSGRGAVLRARWEKRQWKPDEQTFALAVANLVSMQLAQWSGWNWRNNSGRHKSWKRSALAGGIAHDFNNIPAAILPLPNWRRWTMSTTKNCTRT